MTNSIDYYNRRIENKKGGNKRKKEPKTRA